MTVRNILREFSKHCAEESVDFGHCEVLSGFVCEGVFDDSAAARLLAETLNEVQIAHAARVFQHLCEMQTNVYVDATMRKMANTYSYEQLAENLSVHVDAVERVIFGEDPGECKSGLFPNAKKVGADYEPPPMPFASMEAMEGRESTMRKMGPLGKDAPPIGQECPGCKKLFVEGDYVMLITIGPGDDPEQRERCRNNRPYNAVALPVHWACATGEE
jgi:hypothetical protein